MDAFEDDTDDMTRADENEIEDDGEEEDEADDESEGGDGADDLDDNDDEDAAAATDEKDFDELCAALQRNDPERTVVNVRESVAGYGTRLGQALVGNTHVRELELYLFSEHINAEDDDTRGVANIELILQYLRQGTAFRALRILGGTREYTGPCVAAMSQNPNTHILVMFENTQVPLEEVAALIRTSSSLFQLDMPMVNSIAIALAFQASQSLRDVALIFDPDALPPPSGIILRHLASHQSIRDFAIYQARESSSMDAVHVDTALAGYIGEASCLSSLQFVDVHFNKSRMRHVLKGLFSNRSLYILTFVHCSFDKAAVALLEALAHTPSTARSLTHSRICIIRAYEQNDALGEAAVAWLASAGFPHLYHLFVEYSNPHSTNDTFWTLLTANIDKVNLRTLELQVWPCASGDQMNICISRLRSLEELRFLGSRPHTRKQATSLLHTVLKHSNLRMLTIGGKFPEFWNESESRLVRASFKRNSGLFCLVSMPRKDDTAAEDEDKRDTCICLYPSLFLVAKRTIFVARNSILAGLLALSDAIGPA
jgi:hypothetical protein